MNLEMCVTKACCISFKAQSKCRKQLSLSSCGWVLILSSVLGKSLQHYGMKRNVPFTNRFGSSMKMSILEVTDMHKGCGIGPMIVFTPDEKGKIVNDKKCIEQVKQIMESTPGFDIVCDRGAYGVKNERQQSEHNSGISFPVIRKENWERALSQAQQDHQRQQRIQRDVHGENQHTLEHFKVKVPPKASRAHERGASVPRSCTLSFPCLV